MARRATVVWSDGIPWVLKDRILRPLSLPHRWKALDGASVRGAMKKAGAVLAQWTEGWDEPEGDWWYVCCDQKDYDLSTLRKDPRYEVRKGLDQCEVRLCQAAWFAENGYPVYAAAFARYGAPPPLTEEGFVREFREHARYPGRETWGAFLGGKLVAWQSCIVIDDAVLSASSKSDPSHLKAKPNNALLYVLTRHYLRDRGAAYVTSGSRVLLHDTHAQDFKERMGYRKIYALLRAELAPMAAFVASLGLPGWARRLRLEKALGSPIEKLDALTSVARISRACRDTRPRGGTAAEAELRSP